jgi:branched-chain amino acid transport system permease protein
MTSDTARYYVFLALTVAAFALVWRISVTRVGRSFNAIRDSETVAAAYGIRPVRVKLTGFAVAGGIAALAGALVTYQLGSVRTEYASVFFSINWLVNSVIAGIGSIAAPIIGAFFFGLYPEISKGEVQATSISFWPQIVSSALLILVMAVNPGGLASMSRFVRSRASAYDDRDRDPELGEALVNKPAAGSDEGAAQAEEEVTA